MDVLVPPTWSTTIAAIARGEATRLVVIGATDVGKSSFVRAALSAASEGGAPLSLLDLDPGQKMIGPPGTVGLAHQRTIERLAFIGSTSAGELTKIAQAAAVLARTAKHGFIANTAGFVRGLGAKLQSITIEALRPDLIVAIGSEEELSAIVDVHPTIAVVWLERSPLARRKSPSERDRVRQAAFAASLARSEALVLPTTTLTFAPAHPSSWQGESRPICALASADGEALSVGILQEVANEAVVIAERPTSLPVAIQLGKMWAEPTPRGWRLLEQLSPSWDQTGFAL